MDKPDYKELARRLGVAMGDVTEALYMIGNLFREAYITLESAFSKVEWKEITRKAKRYEAYNRRYQRRGERMRRQGKRK